MEAIKFQLHEKQKLFFPAFCLEAHVTNRESFSVLQSQLCITVKKAFTQQAVICTLSVSILWNQFCPPELYRPNPVYLQYKQTFVLQQLAMMMERKKSQENDLHDLFLCDDRESLSLERFCFQQDAPGLGLCVQRERTRIESMDLWAMKPRKLLSKLCN